MRIARLDLARYGRFTDLVLELPRREQDFHLLVGPNEAGKSTLRSAILDLLFGIETRSPYSFRHAYSDMRLGALIEHADEKLDFRRIKARNRTLRAPDDAVLPDTALAPFLGGIERGFFEQMFGLDHERLVTGGQDILRAANDVGQILFQSAAGIASFGAVREALEKEADSLWAKRKAGDREYYIADAELGRAQDKLKLATMRTRDWVAARDEVERLKREAEGVRARYDDLAQRRARLERARRTAPMLQALREREAELDALGRVRLLPADAAERLAEAEKHKAVAASALQLHETQLEEKAKAQAGIRPDWPLLARADDIEALAAQREQVRKHPADRDKRREEARAHWKTLEVLVRDLGWPPLGEEALAARMPPQVVRADAALLIGRHKTLSLALDSARETRTLKQQEIKEVDKELARLPSSGLPPSLPGALQEARALGDVAAQERNLAARAAQAERAFDNARAELGTWQADAARLRGLHPPGSEELHALKEARNRLQLEAERLERDIQGHETRISDLDLAISHYQAAHQPVSLDELHGARERRDALWREIRAGSEPLAAAAVPYEGLVAEADLLADRRHDKAREAATLQSKLDERERFQLQLDRDRNSAAAIQARQDKAAADWTARTEALGLPGMSLDRLGPWCDARLALLSADAALTEARDQLEGLRRRSADAREALAAALAALTPPPGPEDSLASLVQRAADWADSVGQAEARRTTLLQQRSAAEAALESLDARLTKVTADLAAWDADWARSLDALNLPAGTGTAAAEQALSILANMDAHLGSVRELRDARIRPMERDLERFADTARRLAADLDPELAERPPEDIVRILAARLAQARQDARDHARLTAEIETARRQAESEAGSIAAAQAALAPLLDAAGVADNDALREAILASDQARALDKAMDDLKRRLSEGADGLPRERLEAELADLDIGTLPADLAVLNQDLEALVEQQRENAANLRSAETARERIAGQDDAARAEAERQEALARMANAVERYLRTYTAARLLRWAIERYREQRQGPMLGRAGEIFAELTLNSFERLVVDYDKDPPALHGQRPDGERVSIEGLSDGTRDQLYLALRLAALELHLDQSPPMPFIADDLFINWDGARASAGLAALARLSTHTQVIFLTHHDYLITPVGRLFEGRENVIRLA
jgi:uncharacterized protein YhaN